MFLSAPLPSLLSLSIHCSPPPSLVLPKLHRGTPSPPFLEDSIVAGGFLQYMFFFLHQGAAQHHVLLHRPQLRLRPEGDERASADGLVPTVSSSLSCLDLTTILSLSHICYSSFCENVLVAAFCEATLHFPKERYVSFLRSKGRRVTSSKRRNHIPIKFL